MNKLNGFIEIIMKVVTDIIDKKIMSAPFDKTAKATVIDILPNNTYKIQLNGSFYKIVCKEYKLHPMDKVFVKIPQNNLNNIYVERVC